ncbi:DUF6265 family protein [Allosphingosinicella vermicomposti]|uniref:DUF6265 family protein n=1 Tax=Allosphingosinicella vermicomposti TaxID=614671 RepID=UPI000D0EA87E|nr:DUF6265 family protein [Allosphingosinicella vermicomposti]
MRGFLTALASAALVAGPATAQEWQPQPDLSWIAGYWLNCDDDREVAETWGERVGGIQLGYSVTTGKQAFSWEQMLIESEGFEPTDLVFHAQPRGQAPASFRLLSAKGQEVVFENKDNDFPQRIIYRRNGDTLIGRIEGMSEGKMHQLEWQYRAAVFNSHCVKK